MGAKLSYINHMHTFHVSIKYSTQLKSEQVLAHTCSEAQCPLIPCGPMAYLLHGFKLICFRETLANARQR